MALNPSEIEHLRTGGQKLVEILRTLALAAKPGTNLIDLDLLAHELAVNAGGVASFKGYQGYPAHTCLSVNDGIVHCIPTDYLLQEGDLLSIDMGLIYNGIHTDATITVPVGGKASPEAQKLMAGTYAALRAGVAQVRPGGRVSDISAAVEKACKQHGLTIFKEFVGHELGHELHEGLLIPNYEEPGHPSPALREGMALAIEPITGLGSPKVRFESDGWTARTADGQLAAQYEETVLVTPGGVEIITPLENLVRELKIS